MKSIAFGVALCLATTTLWLAPRASAQTAPSETRRADPLNPKAQIPPLVYRSAFKDYRPNAEVEVGAWKDANQAVHQAGGWRASAKEAKQADAPDVPLPAASAASTPSKPPTDKPGGHAHH